MCSYSLNESIQKDFKHVPDLPLNLLIHSSKDIDRHTELKVATEKVFPSKIEEVKDEIEDYN
jgi:hypothetical protein